MMRIDSIPPRQERHCSLDKTQSIKDINELQEAGGNIAGEPFPASQFE
jgi:hypothetical protein